MTDLEYYNATFETTGVSLGNQTKIETNINFISDHQEIIKIR